MVKVTCSGIELAQYADLVATVQILLGWFVLSSSLGGRLLRLWDEVTRIEGERKKAVKHTTTALSYSAQHCTTAGQCLLRVGNAESCACSGKEVE